MDVDLRKLRYFVAVAEESHFGRAAERLHITQPVLSRQIRALEHEVGAQLFTRGRQATELTAAGGQLLEDARPLLASAQALVLRVQQVGHGAATFTVGFMPGITVTRAVREFTARHPELDVQVVRTSWDTQVQSVHEGILDVSFVRLPVEHRGLTLRPLFHEPRVAVLPALHRLAGKQSLVIADLAAEQLLQDPDAVPEWRDLPGRTSAGEAGSWPVFRTVEEKLEHVATSGGVLVLPLSTAAYYTHTDVAHVPIDDIGPNEVCLAWSADRRSPLVPEFADIAAAQH
ncbi:LysR family transcriptional regulator [Streptomyces sp. RKAG293]|uniref:LysR family transcriptional regulator n=1 Tax=Streptomyces sp. RKAG293 TaxID=2893403 RepID=UPI002033B23D|nr:LysR substrate-binding domain-containing protein [Streptomyces sp. RKAG293]MCM2423838.1 LysR substrate-binding domain-containing protein [Streptomyces sp. RKAG293]